MPHYELRHGSYYLIEKVPALAVVNPDGERILQMVDQVAIVINTAWGMLVGHGSPEAMETRAREQREKLRAFGDEEAVSKLIVLTFPKQTADTVINSFLENPMKALDDYDLNEKVS